MNWTVPRKCTSSIFHKSCQPVFDLRNISDLDESGTINCLILLYYEFYSHIVKPGLTTCMTLFPPIYLLGGQVACSSGTQADTWWIRIRAHSSRPQAMIPCVTLFKEKHHDTYHVTCFHWNTASLSGTTHSSFSERLMTESNRLHLHIANENQ